MDAIFENVDSKTKCCCITTTVTVLLVTIITAFSFGSIEPTQYGILYNKLYKDIDKVQIHEGGLSFIGPLNQLIKFPRINQVIEFSKNKDANEQPLSTRTAEGLELQLHVAFQYKLIKEQIPQLYALAGLDYEALFTKIAADLILQQAGHYKAPQYWQNRTYIGNELETELRKKLLKAHANCTALMLLQIDLPDVYENAIVDTQVVIQQTQTAKKIMNSTLVRQEIEVLRSEASRDIAIINATAESRAQIVSNNARAQILNNTISRFSQAYTQVKNTIQTTSSQELLDYIFYMNIMNLDKNSGNTKLLVNVESALVDLQSQSGKGY